ncbi:hypothetical protein N7499_001751 [Penicillium canescens]|nr:hypothetical protein N7499_001751 [Penicillium canescens]KAJ6165367.1 hypothetical protein N7485_008611 [Penicillium canescens]
MSRRPPPRDYYDEEEMYEMERERERDHRPRRRDREYDDDIEYRRRRSDPPVEDLERLHLREADRPRRDFMEESFAHPSGRDDMMLRRSKEETVVLSPERRDHDEPYMPPSGSRLRNRPREIVDEDLIIEERERRRGSRRHPREVEDDLIVEERERHGDRSHRPGREVEDDLIVEERDMRREGRHRPDRVPAGDLIVEERDRRGDRRRRQKTEFEEDDLLVERERRRGGRRHPREIDEEGLIAEEKERRRERRPPPDREFEEDIRFEERERRRPSRRHPERRSEDDLLYETEKRRSRRRPERRSEDDLIEERKIHRSSKSKRHPERDLEEDLIIEEQGRHDEERRRREFEEDEMVIRRRGKEPPMRRGWDSEQDFRRRDRRFEKERDEVYLRSRPRPPPSRGVEVEEILDERPAERPRGAMERQEREFEDDDVLIRWKGKGRRPPHQGDEEELILRERRERRQSPPVEELERELRELRRADRKEDLVDDEMSTRSTFDSKSHPRDLEEDEELDEEIRIRKTKNKHPSRSPSPSMESIHVPPIHQDVFTHHRHIDHGFEDGHPPHVPSPGFRKKGSFDEIDIRHRKLRGGRMSEEDIAIKHRNSDESISPTSHPSVDFHDPWERGTSTSRRTRPLDDDNESLGTARSFSRSRKDAPIMHDLEEDIEIESAPTKIRAPQDTDGWSVVQAPTREEAIEMTGALDIIEVKPRRKSVEQAESGRVAQQITEPKVVRDDRWTEITKKLVVREAIEEMGYEYEETRAYYYIFSYLKPEDIDELVDLTDSIRSARRRRITEIHRERSSVPPPMPRVRPHMGPPRMGMPPRARMMEKRMREMRDRDWVLEPQW